MEKNNKKSQENKKKLFDILMKKKRRQKRALLLEMQPEGRKSTISTKYEGFCWRLQKKSKQF